MTQEEKELLFKNLSARLPYHVKVKVWLEDWTTEEGVLDLEHNYADVLRDAFYYGKIKDIKPYLRPISSMTDEERKEYKRFVAFSGSPGGAAIFIDWLNANHFDYLNLLENGLAIEVTKENNPYKE